MVQLGQWNLSTLSRPALVNSSYSWPLLKGGGKARWRPDDLGSPFGTELLCHTLDGGVDRVGCSSAKGCVDDQFRKRPECQQSSVHLMNKVAPDHRVMLLWNKFTSQWRNITSRCWECPNAVLNTGFLWPNDKNNGALMTAFIWNGVLITSSIKDFLSWWRQHCVQRCSLAHY